MELHSLFSKLKRRYIHIPFSYTEKGFYAAFLALFFATTTHAYVPETGHAPLTQLAVQGYQQCFDNQTFATPNVLNRLLQGNMAMDHGTSSFSDEDEAIPGVITLFHLITRVTNWHFYQPYKKHPQEQHSSKQKNVEMSHKRLWKMAVDGFSKATTPHDKWLFLGALLHLNEDLSVPAHVVPVYHGPTTLVERLGKFESITHYPQDSNIVRGFWLGKKITDQIDQMRVDKTRLNGAIKQQLPAFCQALTTQTLSTPHSIKNGLAKQTLALINQPIPNCPGVKWSRFWDDVPQQSSPPLPSQRYFKLYNSEQGFPLFGLAGLVSDKSGKTGCTLEDNDKRYLDFVFQLHLAAVKADVALLYWAGEGQGQGQKISPRRHGGTEARRKSKRTEKIYKIV
ncbi:MAG: hypothetical protein MJK04_00150 [Psychrosphaera sp.]|nr:hypothetical protein [Psychrosphaera sp.]